MRSIVIVGPPPVQILDVTGPLEVFASAPDYQVTLGAPGPGRALETSRGVALGEAKLLEELRGPIDTLVVAGGPGAESEEPHPQLVQWITQIAPECRRIAAICTGAFVLAEAGLLGGRQAVTHWKFCSRLAEQYPAVHVRPAPIFLRDGNIYTSAGITAGIDLSLALVEEDHGHAVALSIARHLVMFLVRPGGQAQFSHMLSVQATASKPMRELGVWVQENLKGDLTVEALADHVGMSARHFARVCRKELSMNPAQFVERLRIETAQRLIDTSSRGLKEIAEDCGFSSSELMRRSFLRVLGVSAQEYRQRFGRMRD